ncbi:peptide chain release factor N(5)-glutamine methyltransferase [Candidatus Berkiella aquae]|uniref:Release factor glutamine methyltransferase n=1 Tax=Candidatus Berkiella aquae TaxID=295108 RepID=A0A0Q9YVM5_9GAMM|nr:peptide chain release factor N(5)-glutamine methyltransferase [Candidatus Berkiella aquae]MCS5710700.1 peptide chain release factor N(5)-glutamine methyltransferase [Candidatus Berkiella aquae]
MQTIAQLLKHGYELLQGTDNPHLEAQLLLAKALACERIQLIAWPDKQVSDEQVIVFHKLVQRRCQHEPIAYLLEEKEFWSLPFYVNQHVLVPRPETELLVETFLQYLPQDALTVLELGTGSGAIACALASERPHWQIIATDISFEALKVAKSNSMQLNLPNIQWVHANWFAGLSLPPVAAIISNPPYLSDSDPHLKEDLLHEPQSALVSGNTGLEAYETIIANALPYLIPGGLLAFEHGATQSQDIAVLLAKQGYADIKILNDLANIPRITLGFAPK